MRTRGLLPLLALGLGLGVLAAAEPSVEQPAKPDADKIAKLVAQLGSDSFDDREKASADLEAIGDPAYDALRQALKNNDEEIRKRAEILVGKIDRRRESAEALKPKHVHLVYKDTPLTEAIEDFNKQSGCTLVLGDPDGALKDRKITLDTGDVTFWQALQQFCDKAGLQESPDGGIGQAPNGLGVPQPPPAGRPRTPIQPPPPNGANPAPPPAPNGAVPFAAQPAPQPGNPPAPPALPPPPPGGAVIIGGRVGGPIGGPLGGAASPTLSLVDGKADALPADNTSAIRVQALPRADQLGPAPDGQIGIGLRLSIEPRMLLQEVEKVTVTKAIDDQKQELTQTTEDNPGAPLGGVAAPAPGVVGPALRPIGPPGFGFSASSIQQDMAVHFKKGDKPAKTLSELSGVISASILTEPKPIITADDIMKVKAGATFKGGEDGEMTVNDVTKNGDNQVVIRVQLQPPTDSVPAGGLAPGRIRGGGRMRPAPAPPGGAAAPPAAGGGIAVAPIGAAVVGPGWNSQGTSALSLLDDKGKSIKLVGTQVQFQTTVTNNVVITSQVYVLTFELEKDQEPAKLVYNARKILSVDVPFTLKDVPLP
ncbi:MAG TPA: hypothetical protein VMS17_31910 [Gemmataceae bacterium]|nr:hypothetical protein [Gemmataceae bacterium]